MIPKEVNISLWCSQMGRNGSMGTPKGNQWMGRVSMDLQDLVVRGTPWKITWRVFTGVMIGSVETFGGLSGYGNMGD